MIWQNNCISVPFGDSNVKPSFTEGPVEGKSYVDSAVYSPQIVGKKESRKGVHDSSRVTIWFAGIHYLTAKSWKWMSKEPNDSHIPAKSYLSILTLNFSTWKAQFWSATLWYSEKLWLWAGGALSSRGHWVNHLKWTTVVHHHHLRPSICIMQNLEWKQQSNLWTLDKNGGKPFHHNTLRIWPGTCWASEVQHCFPLAAQEVREKQLDGCPNAETTY